MKITDEYIRKIFKDKNGNICAAKLRLDWLNKHKDIKEYLENRYDTFFSYKSTIQYIFAKKNKLNICLTCGKYLSNPISKYCSTKCQLTNPDFIKERNSKIDYKAKTKKFKQTCLERYGVEVPAQNKEIMAKMVKNHDYEKGNETYKQTCLNKYGVENAFQVKEFIDKGQKTKKKNRPNDPTNHKKQEQTMLAKYGVKSALCNGNLREKGLNTKEQKYGDRNYTNKEKYKQTCLNKYGVDNSGKIPRVIEASHTSEVNQKRIETKRKNGTFNTSKLEEDFYTQLLEVFDRNDIERQYREERYPFNCDFYIKSLDLFIEVNGTWTHNTHWFDKHNQEDMLTLNKWRDKNTKFYNNAIYNWTIRDVEKREIAKNNNLNYVVLWNREDIENWFKSDCSIRQDWK